MYVVLLTGIVFYTKISHLTSPQAKDLIRCNIIRLFAYVFLHDHRHKPGALSRYHFGETNP